MPLEIRQMTVKSVIQRTRDDVGSEDLRRELDAFREELLEECRRIIADERKAEEER